MGSSSEENRGSKGQVMYEAYQSRVQVEVPGETLAFISRDEDNDSIVEREIFRVENRTGWRD